MDEVQVAVFRRPGPEARPAPEEKDRACRTVVCRLACLLSFILSAVSALTAQSFDERFSDCFSKGDTAASVGGVCRASGGVFWHRAERLFPHGAAESDRVGG